MEERHCVLNANKATRVFLVYDIFHNATELEKKELNTLSIEVSIVIWEKGADCTEDLAVEKILNKA